MLPDKLTTAVVRRPFAGQQKASFTQEPNMMLRVPYSGELIGQVISNLAARKEPAVPEVIRRGPRSNPVPLQHLLEALWFGIGIKGMGIVSQCITGQKELCGECSRPASRPRLSKRCRRGSDRVLPIRVHEKVTQGSDPFNRTLVTP